MMYPTFDQLVALGLAQELSGWDFSWLTRRTSEEPLPWDYERIARSRMAGVQAVLDIDTGGGELYSRLGPFPMVAWATEGYPPNVSLARARLEPLGIQVADTSAISGLLPFVDDTFDLVLNRHGGLYASELERVMRPGGQFVTQQVGSENCIEINRALQEVVSFEYSYCTLEYTSTQLEQVGLQIIEAREVFPQLTFHDIAAVVFYLKAISWQIADFSVEKYHDQLLHIHEEIVATGNFSVHEHRVFIEAVKPL
jgi:SAM-dependent methyltransferase